MRYGQWEAVGALPEFHHVETLFVSPEHNALWVAGYYQSLDSLLETDIQKNLATASAVILWRSLSQRTAALERVYTGSGHFLQLGTAGPQNIIGLGRRYHVSGGYNAFLIRSIDGGRNWTPGGTVPIEARGMYFLSESRGYLWTGEDIYETSDAGQTWTSCQAHLSLARGGPAPTADLQGTLYWVTDSQLFIRSLDGKRSSVTLPAQFDVVNLQSSANGVLFLLGYAEANRARALMLLRWQPGHALMRVNALSGMNADFFAVASNRLYILASHAAKDSPVSMLLFSEDAGRTFKEEQPLLDATAQPAAMDSAGGLWTSAPLGRLQHRHP